VKSGEKTVLGVLLALTIVALGAVFFTRDWTDYRERLRALTLVSERSSRAVDTHPLDTAAQLAQLAVTPAEHEYAEEALRFADHSVDLGFDAAMRDAAENPAPPTPQTKEIQARIKKTQAGVTSDQDLVSQLTEELAKARPNEKDGVQDTLGIAQAQLSLDQDDLEDAQQDLIRAGGDKQAGIQQLLDQHNASETHSSDSHETMMGVAPGASIELTTSESIVARSRAWMSLEAKRKALAQAQHDSLNLAAQFSAAHEALEKNLDEEKAQKKILHKGSVDTSSQDPTLFLIHNLAGDQKDLSNLDKRVQFEKQLAGVYGNWIEFVGAREQAFLHGLILCVFWILLIAVLVLGANYSVQRLFTDAALERHHLHALRTVTLFAVQAVGIVLILLVILGMPSNLATVVALAGAGVTVAMKDFIVGFFGWFILMGKNGIHPGDWVEINGVAGEVIEVGFLHTVLLETGSWTDAGHPTGRKVSFVNSFAIEGHYFNFSTSGQWLWDEIQVQVPDSSDPYVTAEAIQKIVADETATNAKLAESEWSRVKPGSANRPFSAAPSLSVRPAGSGVTVLVRYLTRVNERHEVRARLYRAVVELLHRKQIPESAAVDVGGQPTGPRA
jgi:small-conductance mechanosensitive channel